MRTTHNSKSDTTDIPRVSGRVSVTTSQGSRYFWIDVGTWPESRAATLTVDTSKALRKALKRAERISQGAAL